MIKSEATTARIAKKRGSSPSLSRTGSAKKSAGTSAGESSDQLILSLWKMSQRRGIKREAIFRKDAPRKIYAYYVLASDPSKIIREDANGEKLIGRVTNGKFRVLKSITR